MLRIHENTPNSRTGLRIGLSLVWFAGATPDYSAIGDTVSCDAPFRAIGFKGKFFLRCPPSKACRWLAIGHLYRKKGCIRDSLHPDPPILAFLEKARVGPQKARVFLFAEPLKSLEKERKNTQKSKGNRKTKKARKSKKARIGGIVCNTTENTVRQRYCYTCLAMGGGYFGRATKSLSVPCPDPPTLAFLTKKKQGKPRKKKGFFSLRNP